MADNSELVNALSGGGLLNGIAHPAQVNYLAAYGGAQDVASKIWANREWQAKQAAGNAFQNSLNPDGTTNQPQLLQNLRDPNAALAAQDSAQKGQTLSADEYSQTMKRMAYGASGFSQILVDNNGQAPYAAVKSYYDRAVQDGHLTAADEAKVMSGFGPDPAANASIGRQRMMQNIQAQEALARANGAHGTVTGPDGQLLGTNANSQSGAISVPPQAGAPQGLTPNEKFAPTQIGVTAKGAPITGTRAQFIERATGGVPSPLGTGRPAPGSPLLNSPGPASSVAPAGGGIVTGLGPAESAAQQTTGTQSAQAFQQYANDGNKAVQQNAILGNMLGDTKDFTTGPLNSRIKAFQSFTSTYAPKISGYWGLDPKTVAANESFDKLAAQLADAQGAGSDNRLAVNQAANPHGEMSPASVDLVLRQLQGNADYSRAKADLAHAYPDKSDNTGFESAARKSLDPRAFQFARMTVPQRQTYAAALSKDDKTAVQGAYNWAVTHGMIGGVGASQ